MKLDQRQRYSLFKMIEDARRATREPSVITLCDLLDQTLPTFNPDYCQRQGIPVATVIPELTMHRVAAAHAAFRHEEKTIALCERLLKLQPYATETTATITPDATETPATPPPVSVAGGATLKKPPRRGGRPPTGKALSSTERARKRRAQKKAELDQVLKGSERRK